MNFLAPLAFVFAATLPVVILFYLLKRKRVVKLVSSTVLWQKFLAESQASAPFQRLRKNWLLLLQILFLLLAILALARPFFATPAKQGRLLVAILDASASMQAKDVAPSRFDVAQKEARQWVDSLHDNDQMVVLQSAASTQVIQSPTSSKRALREALRKGQVTDGPTRLAEALKLAETLTRDRANSEIHLFSDGVAGELSSFESKGLPLVYHKIGKRGENLAITALDIRTHPEEPARRALYASVANFSSNAVQTGLELRFEGSLLETKPIQLQPRETLPLVFYASQERDGIFSLRLTAEDDLSSDNQASVVSLLPRPMKVLLASRGNRFLEKALQAAPRVQLTAATEVPKDTAGFDVAVVDAVQTDHWPSINLLAIQSAPANWFAVASRMEAPPIVDWKATHPLMRFVNLDNVQIGEASGIRLPPWGVAVVDSPQTPLIVAGEIKRQRIVWIGFDTLQSTWPLRISFPIFMANALEWLNPANANAAEFQVRAGEPFRLAFNPGQTNQTAEITFPDGHGERWPLDRQSSEFVFGDTHHAGVYRIKSGTNETVFCANLLDATESDLLPRDELSLGKFSKVTATTIRRANLEIWRTFAAIALLIFLWEWWYYHRRTA